MKFRFCGDLDCPDWVLAEISTLSKLTSIKTKLLCMQVIKELLGESIDYGKAQKLTSDAKFELGDVKAAIAALNFIISSSAKYNVDGESVCNELQQLGLPKEHSVSLCKSYADNLEKLKEKFQEQSMRLSHLDSVDWRVDYIIGSSEMKEVNEPSVQLKLQTREPDTGSVTTAAFTMSSDKLRILIHELKQAYGMMEDLTTS